MLDVDFSVYQKVIQLLLSKKKQTNDKHLKQDQTIICAVFVSHTLPYFEKYSRKSDSGKLGSRPPTNIFFIGVVPLCLAGFGSTDLPFMIWSPILSTLSTVSLDSNKIKPNPRERPVFKSVFIFASSTTPYFEKYSIRCSE